MTELAGLLPTAARIVRLCGERRLRVATAESCTGGLVAAAITEIAGASAVFDRGFVTYSDLAKAQMLGVDAGLIHRLGAVSPEVAAAMAAGALAHSAADIVVAVTGIAGPGGGSAEKPVGLVHFAARRRVGAGLSRTEVFADSGRSGVRLAAAAVALELIEELI